MRWWTAVLVSAAALQLSAAAAQPEPVASAGFADAGRPYVFSFPRDEGSHPAYQTEWWYTTGHVRAADGRRFGYELTFFRVGLHPGDPAPRRGQSRWRGNEVFPAHLAITDVTGARFVYAERFEREALGMGAAASGRLAVRAGDWTLVGVPGRARGSSLPSMRMTLHASAPADAGDIGVDLLETPLKPPAVHGRAGVSRKGACPSCASHYYSYTRMQTSGSLRFAGTRMRVAGTSWMDHEFGSAELEPGEVGWDWFSVQLNDGRELMLYRLRTASGAIVPASSGSVIERDGRVRHLARADVAVEQRGTWRSPHTGATYPSGWRVRVPSAAIDVTLEPLVLDQELAGASSPSYWEGAVDVRDARKDVSIGAGYVELTGYAGPVSI